MALYVTLLVAGAQLKVPGLQVELLLVPVWVLKVRTEGGPQEVRDLHEKPQITH